MTKRRRVKQTRSLEERLAENAAKLKERANCPLGWNGRPCLGRPV